MLIAPDRQKIHRRWPGATGRAGSGPRRPRPDVGRLPAEADPGPKAPFQDEQGRSSWKPRCGRDAAPACGIVRSSLDGPSLHPYAQKDPRADASGYAHIRGLACPRTEHRSCPRFGDRVELLVHAAVKRPAFMFIMRRQAEIALEPSIASVRWSARSAERPVLLRTMPTTTLIRDGSKIGGAGHQPNVTSSRPATAHGMTTAAGPAL